MDAAFSVSAIATVSQGRDWTHAWGETERPRQRLAATRKRLLESARIARTTGVASRRLRLYH